MIAATEEERSIILKVLKKHVPDCEVRVFGSRCIGPKSVLMDYSALSPEFRKIIDRQYEVILYGEQ
jgi:hypothetical protein